jgi:A/G-specific adenine glycosylase
MLVRHYRREGRRFPWRSTNDPYVVLVSELLLQKTPATRVAEVLKEFLKKWPSIQDLAAAELNDIERMIGTLGLTKRARFLKEVAVKIVEAHKGEIPRGEALANLPGIGRYTANAIRCFAYGERVPIVDANVARVLKRYFGIRGDKPAHGDESLWKLAHMILPQKKYREFNYGLLDTAAKYCRPKPLCAGCPLKSHCSQVSIAQRAKGRIQDRD